MTSIASLLNRPLMLIACVAFTILPSLKTQGAVVTYTSSASFFSDLASNGFIPQTENFDSETAGTTYTVPSTIGGITFQDFGPPDLLVTDDFATTSGLNYLGMNSVALANQFSGGYEIDMTFADSFAIGFNIITGEIPPPNAAQSIFDDDIQIVVPGHGTALLDVDALEATIGGTDSVFFVGLIDTTTPFTSAQVRYADAAVGTITFNVDDITTAVPEPGSGLAGLGGLVGLAFVQQRRRANRRNRS